MRGKTLPGVGMEEKGRNCRQQVLQHPDRFLAAAGGGEEEGAAEASRMDPHHLSPNPHLYLQPHPLSSSSIPFPLPCTPCGDVKGLRSRRKVDTGKRRGGEKQFKLFPDNIFFSLSISICADNRLIFPEFSLFCLEHCSVSVFIES